MNVTLADLKFVKLKDGVGLRCALTVEGILTIEDCLARRTAKNELVFLPPAKFLRGGGMIRNITLFPAIQQELVAMIEKKFGSRIEYHERIRGKNAALPVSMVSPYYETRLDISVE